MNLFSSSSTPKAHVNVTFGLKVDTQSPGWDKTLNKVLRQINGVNYIIDAEEGMAYITGKADPNKILRKLAKAGKHAELCWVETGNLQTTTPAHINPSYGSAGNHGFGYPYPGYEYPYPYRGYRNTTDGYYHQSGYHIPDQYRLPYYGHQTYPSWA